MIGLAVDLARSGCTDEAAEAHMTRCFSADVKVIFLVILCGLLFYDTFMSMQVEVSLAPGAGLYLDELFFDRCTLAD